ncbi:MAG TPA: hypothetical protein VH500_08210, partial [Nitrososphaeraceae archaeon]
NANLNSIEHHCKYSDLIQHKEAILRILQTENSIKSVSGSNSILTTNRSAGDSAAPIVIITNVDYSNECD